MKNTRTLINADTGELGFLQLEKKHIQELEDIALKVARILVEADGEDIPPSEVRVNMTLGIIANEILDFFTERTAEQFDSDGNAI